MSYDALNCEQRIARVEQEKQGEELAIDGNPARGRYNRKIG